jgi:beta-galactosidase
MRVSASTAVKIYSNCERVILKVNGRLMGEIPMTTDHVFVLENVTLRPGNNIIEVEAKGGNKSVKDTCRWVLTTGVTP